MQKKIDKKRKLLLLALFVVPGIAGIAWLMFNSMKGGTNATQQSNTEEHFNTKMPGANLKKEDGNKLEIYMKAQKDSAKLKEQEGKDQHWFFDPGPPGDEIFADEYVPPTTKPARTYGTKTSVALNEKKVKDRLDKLQAALNTNEQPTYTDNFSSQPDNPSPDNPDIARMEKLLAMFQTPDSAGSTEMKQLETMMDKLLDIQHPERVKERISPNVAPTGGTATSITTKPVFSQDSLNKESANSNGFWGLEPEQSTEIANQAVIQAVIHADQQVQDNTTLKLRLLQDIYLNGNLIPSGSFIAGVCRLSTDRVLVTLQEITYGNAIYPVSLTLYDTDGMEGIRVMGGTGADIAQGEVNRSIQSMQLYNPDPSIASQTATAGIQTLKSLLTKKGRKAEAGVKAGHKVLLKIKSNQ